MLVPTIAISICAAAEVVSISLSQAIELAEKRNLELAAAKLKVPLAQAERQAAGTFPNPTLGLSIGPDEPKIFGTLDQKLPIFGQRRSAINAAAAQVPVAQAEIALATLQLRNAVRRNYAVLSVSQSQIDVARETARLARDLAEVARKRYQAGAAPQFEAEQGLVAQRRAEQDVQDREAAREVASIRLGLVIGEAPSTRLEASDPLIPLPGVGSIDELLGQASEHPDLKAAQREREAALARAHRERVAVVPVPTASLQVQHDTTTPPLLALRGGFSFDAPILSQNQGAIRVQETQAAQAEARGTVVARRLQADIRAAYSRWDASARRVRFYQEELVPAAIRVADLAKLAYSLGRTPLSNVLQAQGDLASARSRALDAGGEAWSALADLEEAVGANP